VIACSADFSTFNALRTTILYPNFKLVYINYTIDGVLSHLIKMFVISCAINVASVISIHQLYFYNNITLKFMIIYIYI